MHPNDIGPAVLSPEGSIPDADDMRDLFGMGDEDFHLDPYGEPASIGESKQLWYAYMLGWYSGRDYAVPDELADEYAEAMASDVAVIVGAREVGLDCDK